MMQSGVKIMEAVLPGLVKCENPNCGRTECKFRRTELTEEGLLKLCPPCYAYARRTDKLRSAEMVKKGNRLRLRPKVRYCHNSDCLVKCETGLYAKDNGEYYCNACGVYRKTHGTDRPKSLIVARERNREMGPSFGECENPNCRMLVGNLRKAELEKEGWLRLCDRCYRHARSKNELRSVETVHKSAELRQRRQARGKCCFNKNCRTTHMEGGFYGKHNNQFYCRRCAVYVNNHNGEERPKLLADATKGCSVDECENPSCNVTSSLLRRSVIEGEGTFRLCKSCYDHASKAHHFRTAEAIRKTEVGKRRRAGQVRCHNANCLSTDLPHAGFAKWNGEYYCGACRTYVDEHNGVERPKKLVEENELRKSRYMWQLRHPKIPEDL